MKLFRAGVDQTERFGSLVNSSTGARITTGATARIHTAGAWGNATNNPTADETDQWSLLLAAAEIAGNEITVVIDHADAAQPIVESYVIEPINTWYVATAANGGSDTNIGTKQSPLLTVQQAVDRASAYDAIMVGPGDFNEKVTVSWTTPVHLHGAGIDATRIWYLTTAGAEAYEPVVLIRSGTIVSDMEIRSTQVAGGGQALATFDLDDDAPEVVGTLTTRTSDSVGVFTSLQTHIITTGSTVHLNWSSVNGGQREAVLVGTVAGNVIPISSGIGKALPTQGSAMYARRTCTGVTLERVRLIGPKDGLYAPYTNNSTYHGVLAFSNWDGGNISYSHNLYIENSHFQTDGAITDVEAYGLAAHYTTGLLLRNTNCVAIGNAAANLNPLTGLACGGSSGNEIGFTSYLAPNTVTIEGGACWAAMRNASNAAPVYGIWLFDGGAVDMRGGVARARNAGTGTTFDAIASTGTGTRRITLAGTSVTTTNGQPTQLSGNVRWFDDDIGDTLVAANELQTDWRDGGRLDLLLDAKPTTTDMNTRTLPTADYATAANQVALGEAMAEVPGAVAANEQVAAALETIAAMPDAQAIRDAMKLAPSEGAAEPDSIDDKLTILAAAQRVSPFLVDDDHTWHFDSPTQLTSPNVLSETIGTPAVLLAMDLTVPMPAADSIDTVTAVVIGDVIGATEPTITTYFKSADRKAVHVIVDTTLATAATYTFTFTIVTADSQTFERRGRLLLR